MKRILSVVAAVMFAVMAASPAMALDYEAGDFLVGIFGTNDTLAMEFGSRDMDTDAMAGGIYMDLFDITDIGTTFSGDTSLDQLQVVGASVSHRLDTTTWMNDDFSTFAIEQGAAITLSTGGLNGVDGALSTGGGLYDDDVAGTAVSGANNVLANSLGNGDLNGYINPTGPGTVSLADLASGPVVMDIYMADSDNGFALVKSEYQLTIGLNGNMVYAEVAPVPVPGALILLGSGIMALVGVRRKNA